MVNENVTTNGSRGILTERTVRGLVIT